MVDDPIAFAIERECHSLLHLARGERTSNVLREACEASIVAIDFEGTQLQDMNLGKKLSRRI
jgi:hypothetical protein